MTEPVLKLKSNLTCPECGFTEELDVPRNL